MTQKNLDEIFSKAFEKKEYQDYISKARFNENSYTPELAIFIVPNIFLANWIKTKYEEKMLILIEKHFNVKPELRFILETQKRSVRSSKQVSQNAEAILNPSYTFETFICGESNEFAYKIAKTISEKQAKIYNPVLLYGGTGLGKTHLLNAIGNEVIKKNKIVIYVTAEQFLNDYTARLLSNSMEKFREKYRKCDYLLIDDVQFFGGKEKIQDEFFHTFNELHSKSKQIVMTSDKNPNHITGLEERLKSRFEWGILADIQPPGIKTKIEIIKQKCVINKIHIDNDIIEHIATNVGENIRQIEGLIIRLNAHSSLLRETITLESVKNALKDIQKQNTHITIDGIIKATAKRFNIKPSEIQSKSRQKEIAKARRVVIFLSKKHMLNSMTIVAQSLNMKDHSAVSKALKQINKEIEEIPATKLLISEIESQL